MSLYKTKVGPHVNNYQRMPEMESHLQSGTTASASKWAVCSSPQGQDAPIASLMLIYQLLAEGKWDQHPDPAEN